MTDAWAVVVAAGKGERSGLTYNKVFHPLNGKNVLSLCLKRLIQSRSFRGIVLVLAEADLERYDAVKGTDAVFSRVDAVVIGGLTRQQSVLNGLKAVPESVEIVAVHDAARPFTSPELIRATVESARLYGSGVAAAVLTDTIKVLDGRGYAKDTLKRSELRAVQTPQTFRLSELLSAYQQAEREGFSATDDAQIIEKYIGPVRLVENAHGARNIKLTLAEDLNMFSRPYPKARVGYGYDAHRFTEGRKLVLCGVAVPFEQGLLGHSDADVAAHALMDALLGAVGKGDIGRHFPDSDSEYAGISSMLLLKRVRDMLLNEGFTISNADVTIVAQKPRLLPYIDRMVDALADVLAVDRDLINIKATTTEQMGFTGRMEGISASAVALIVREGDSIDSD